MDLTLKIFAIFLLILAAAYFAISEISLAGSRRVRLTQMAEAGDSRAQEVLNLQEKPGPFFSVIQIGINAVAILGGIVGEPLREFSTHFLSRFFLSSIWTRRRLSVHLL